MGELKGSKVSRSTLPVKVLGASRLVTVATSPRTLSVFASPLPFPGAGLGLGLVRCRYVHVELVVLLRGWQCASMTGSVG